MINIQENVSLAQLNTFRIGGNARYFAEVKSLDELKEVIDFSKQKGIDFYILGGGSNILVSDNGFDGLIIKIKMNEMVVKEGGLEIEAGVPLIKVVNFACQNGLSGIEDLAGIPGTFGGAVRGNAGAFGSEIGLVIGKVTVFDTQTGEQKDLPKEKCEFEYRSSFFKKNKNFIILKAEIVLEKSEKEKCEELAKSTIQKRTSKNLGAAKSAGSFFMNPEVDEKLLEEFAKENGQPSKNGKVPAGWIIDQAGLRGKKIGGAQISEQHANYLVNADEATAEDVIMLASYVKQQVRDKFGVQLTEEVNYVGF